MARNNAEGFSPRPSFTAAEWRGIRVTVSSLKDMLHAISREKGSRRRTRAMSKKHRSEPLESNFGDRKDTVLVSRTVKAEKSPKLQDFE